MSFRTWYKRLVTAGRYRPDDSVRAVQKIIGYTIINPQLLANALTHRSYANNLEGSLLCNERLEFLGDSILGLIISEQLFRDYPRLQEGELTKTKAMLVNESALAECGLEWKINEHIYLASEEDRTGGRARPSIIADAMESIFAAVYLDGGLEASRDVVLRLLYTRRDEILADASRRNFKGELLELAQARVQGLPRYDVVAEEGPDHQKTFHVKVFINGTCYGEGSGTSKKEAEQNAAAEAVLKYAPI
jgi:ribonuclease-3